MIVLDRDDEPQPPAVRVTVLAEPGGYSGKVELPVTDERPVDLDLLRGRLCSALTGAGLRDPDVHLRAVSLLPRNGETGKLRRFVPLDSHADASHAGTAGAGLPGA